MSAINKIQQLRTERIEHNCGALPPLPPISLPFELSGQGDWFRLNLRPYGHSPDHVGPASAMIFDVNGPETADQRVRNLLRAFRSDFDFDHDGKIGKMEMLRGRLLLAQARELDKDHDGVICPEELCGTPAKKWWIPQPEKPQVPDLSRL